MRPLVRSTALALTAAPLSAATLAAQPWRVSVTPFVGRTLSSPVFEHEARQVVNFPTSGGGGQAVTFSNTLRLTLDDATVAGARVELGMGGPLSVFVEGAYGGTHFSYLDSASSVGSGPDPIESWEMSRRRGRASAAALALGVGYAIPLGRPELELGLGAAASVQRLAFDWRDAHCKPPSLGVAECTEADPWEERYRVPGGAGSLSLRWALTASLGVEARSTFSVGRASTESFRESYVPPYQGAEPETRHWVRGTQLSLGLSYRR